MPSRRTFLTAVGTAGLAGLAGCTDQDGARYSPGTDADTEWPMPAYDRGFSAYNPDAAAPRDGVSERWSVEITGPSARPVVAAGTVLVPTVAALVALDLDSGEEHWRHGEEQPWPCAPAVHDGTAYVGFADRPGLVALDVATGDEEWRVETEDLVRAAPTFDHDYDFLYVGDVSGHVYEVDLAEGAVTARGEVFGAVSAVASDLMTIVVGTRSGEVSELHPRQGTFRGLWRQKVGGAVTALAARSNAVLVGTFGGPTYRLEKDRVGSVRWENDPGASHLATTWKDVVGGSGLGLRQFDAATGDVGWTRDARFGAAPAIAGDTVYVGGGKVGSNGSGFVGAYALSGGTGVGPLRFGGERWRFEVESAVMEGVAVADGAVFAVTQNLKDSPSRVYALDPA